jgi:hypothetical protein
MLERGIQLSQKYLEMTADSGDIQAIVGQLVISAALGALTYTMFIFGLELGGMSQGYPGRGREMHEKIMRELKETFTRPKRRK